MIVNIRILFVNTIFIFKYLEYIIKVFYDLYTEDVITRLPPHRPNSRFVSSIRGMSFINRTTALRRSNLSSPSDSLSASSRYRTTT